MQQREEISDDQTSSRIMLIRGKERRPAALRLAPLHRLGTPLASVVAPRARLTEGQQAPYGASPVARTAATRSREYLAAARGRGRGSDRDAYLRAAASWRANERQQGEHERTSEVDIHVEDTCEKTCALGTKLRQVTTVAAKGLQAAADFVVALGRDIPPRVKLHYKTQVTCFLVTVAIVGFAFINAVAIAPKEGEVTSASELCPEDSQAVYNYSRIMSFAAIFFAGAILNFKEFLSIPLF